MYRFVTVITVLLLATPAWADIDVCTDPGYCGTDGVFNPLVSEEVDLSIAASLCDCDGDEQVDDECRWDCPSPIEGQGVYDPEKWAVVFKYESVNIPVSRTVTFKNHPSGAPVVWLVEGDVIIDGSVVLNGVGGHSWTQGRTYAEPGPGGFRGGRSSDTDGPGSGGFGPGGASSGDGGSPGSGGSYAESGEQGTGGAGLPGPPYGNARVLPLIGGSGGSGSNNNSGGGGGAGGGAILIATNTSLILNGNLWANGGSRGTGAAGFVGGTGSGGGIRLIADSVEGSGELRATSGCCFGAVGRIRVESNMIALTDLGIPLFDYDLPSDPVALWPDATIPVITNVSLAGESISPDPKRGLNFPDQEVVMSSSEQIILIIDALNVPIAEGEAEMIVRVILKSGLDFTVEAVFQSGDSDSSTWQADLVMPGDISAIQVRVELP